jgi:3-oxoacyl-[acyl-carrier-protein] synthase-1
MPRRIPVYLSAPGLLCCAGNGGEAFLRAALEGDRSGIVPVSQEGRPFLAGRIPDSFFPPAGRGGQAAQAAQAGLPRLLRIAGAALEQIRPAVEAVVARCGPGRVGVCVGSCDNGAEQSLEAHGAYFASGGFPENYRLRFQGAAYPAEYLARECGASGPVLAVSTACASGAGAVLQGAALIRGGLCDAVIAGGADLASKTALLGFDSLEALSEAPCNPFSKNRRGINLGEGAAFFVLSREPLGPPVALLGAGESADAYHITAPRPDGAGAIRAMERALAAAGMSPADIGYVNLHGTGTPQGDAMEALAMGAVFPAPGPPVSSTKPVTGHTLGAAGALELALCWLLLARAGGGAPQALPVHCWDGVRDGELPELCFAGPRSAAVGLRACMSNSFAFGGCNISLIIGRE